jgi:selenocysteine lyase/cysteine desulfurase
VRRVEGDADGRLDMEGLRRALDGARLFVINAASNVLGTRLDVEALAALARDAGVISLVDSAQAAGHLPFDTAASGVDLVAFTGHKGMLGPHGIGGLWVREGIGVDPLLRGGTGGNSLLPGMPDAYPDHLEAGTQNAPAMAGLLAGIEFVLDQSVERIATHARALKARLRAGLADVPGIRLRSPAAPDGAPIVTFTADTVDPNTLAARLDRQHGVLVRPGLHCAPDAHRLLGTEATGAVRMSLGWASTETDVDRAVGAIRAILADETVAASIP